jgi:hypothetical protein
MAKKMKCFDEGGYTGDDPIVKYRLGITDKPKEKEKEEPEFETKMGKNEAISDDTRARAMKFVEKSDEAKKEVKPKSTSTARKVVAKAKTKTSLPMPDYSNEDLDRMGLNDDLKPATRFSPAAAAGVTPAKPAPGYMMKSMGYKSGGKVKSASARADGCCVRGKTRA